MPLDKLFVIVVPPFSLSLESMKLIEGNFNVICLQKVTDVKRLAKPETGAKQMLILTESFEGIMGLTKQYSLNLFVHKIGQETANLLVKRYY